MESESEYPLTTFYIGARSDSETETATSEMGPLFSTQQILGSNSYSEPENSTPDSPPPPSPANSDITPQVMEIRPNSTQENSTGKRRVPFLPITQDAVLEHYVLKRAIDHCLVRNMKPITLNQHAYKHSSFTTGRIRWIFHLTL